MNTSVLTPAQFKALEGRHFLDAAGERLGSFAETMAEVKMSSHVRELIKAEGVYTFECRDKDGNLRWTDTIDNTVVTVGKNAMLTAWLQTAAYTQTGPFMGLISSVSFSAISAADTMGSHAGWTEAGSTNAPDFTARITANGDWAAASAGAIALTTALSFAITSSGTLEGAFMVLGSGAVATLMSTAGVLFSAGLFTGGTRAVLNGDTVNVSYSLAI